MTDYSRRDLARLTGAAVIAGIATRAGLAQAPAATDPLRHVDPELLPVARTLLQQGDAQWTDEGLTKMRAGGNPPGAPWLTDVPVQELKVPVGKGQPEVTVFVINAKRGANRPAIVHMHGGGYIVGSARGEVAYEQAMARTLDCTIVTVEYRLAPETTYVGSIEDNYAGLRWLHANAERLGVDRTRIVAMGESAGGGHAARLAITARDRGEVPLAAQILIYPMLDDRTATTIQLPSYIGALLWTPKANRLGWKSFLGMEPGGPRAPAAGVPARVRDLTGLPPAYIAVGAVDLFVREDIEYARRLIEAGVPTELNVTPGAFHAFDRLAPDTMIARHFEKAKLNALRKAFGQPLEL